MHAPKCAPFPGRRRCPLYPAAAAAALLLLAASAAQADDLFTPAALGKGLTLMLASSPLAWAIYTAVICLIESVVLKVFLRAGYLRCLGYAVVANAVSAAISAMWYFTGGNLGWKTAWILERWASVAVLLIRSYLVTVAVEALVVSLMVRGRRSSAITLAAVAVANVVTYGLTAVLMAV